MKRRMYGYKVEVHLGKGAVLYLKVTEIGEIEGR